MQLQTLLGVTAGMLAFVAAITYIRSILQGDTKPERGAMIIWAITSTISFFSYWAEGAQGSVWFAAGDFIVGIIMLALAFKYGYGWNIKRHTIALLTALIGLILWASTNQPFLALLCSVGVDAVGAALIVVKAYEAPHTEHVGSWVIYLVGAFLGLAAVGSLEFPLLFYPAYALCSTLAVILAILLGRRTKQGRLVPKQSTPQRLTERVR